jgi:hypothetical protein
MTYKDELNGTCVYGEDAGGKLVESAETGFHFAELVQLDAVETFRTLVAARIVLRIAEVDIITHFVNEGLLSNLNTNSNPKPDWYIFITSTNPEW